MKYLFQIWVFFCVISLLSCAQKQDAASTSFEVTQASQDARSGYMSCNSFLDDTFYGRLKPASEQGCFNVEILEAPSNVFDERFIFLQAYPFSVQREQMIYGSSLEISIYEKKWDWSSNNTPVFKTSVIDSSIIEDEMKTDKEDFFNNHYFKICAGNEEWEALQFVLYLKKDSGESTPLRVSQFLLPPFLSDPQRFRGSRGNQLAVFHPFLETMQNLDEYELSYHDLSEEICDFNI